eukprot:642118-Rhodomonas_salina.3
METLAASTVQVSLSCQPRGQRLSRRSCTAPGTTAEQRTRSTCSTHTVLCRSAQCTERAL